MINIGIASEEASKVIYPHIGAYHFKTDFLLICGAPEEEWEPLLQREAVTQLIVHESIHRCLRVMDEDEASDNLDNLKKLFKHIDLSE